MRMPEMSIPRLHRSPCWQNTDSYFMTNMNSAAASSPKTMSTPGMPFLYSTRNRAANTSAEPVSFCAMIIAIGSMMSAITLA